MDKPLEILAELHERSKTHYAFNDCEKVAAHIARVIRDQGRTPQFFRISSSLGFKPLAYKDMDGFWHWHVIVAESGMVYDPIQKEPIPIQDYTQRIFGKELKLEPLHNPFYQ